MAQEPSSSGESDGTLRVTGPFLGIDTETEQNRLLPTQAVDLVNVLLHRERIQKRYGVLNRKDFPSGASINHMNTVVNPGGGVQVLAIEEGGIHVITGPFGAATEQEVTSGLQADPGMGSIAQLSDKVYVALGLAGNWVVEATGVEGKFDTARPAGLPGSLAFFDDVNNLPWIPLDFTIWIEQWHGGGAPPDDLNHSWSSGVYDFAVSLYDELSDTESNATFANHERSSDGAIGGATFVVALVLEKSSVEGVPPGQWTHYRVYCKPVSVVADVSDPATGDSLIGGETQYRLCAQIGKNDADYVATTADAVGIALTGQEFDNMTTGFEGAVPLSVKGIGPFAPIKNGIPPKSTAIVAYDSKILWASGSKIYFSEDLKGGTVAELDFVIPGEGREEEIKYMTVYQGRLVIFRETEIYVLSGSIARQSNDSLVLGQPPPLISFAIHQPVDYAGCINRGGIGAVEAGGTLFFNGFDGLYAFNGLTAIKVSDRVDLYYREFELEDRALCTMAADTLNGLLWVVFKGKTQSLCYDFRSKNRFGDTLGVWTVHEFVGRAQCTCPAAPYGRGQDVPFDDEAVALFVLDGNRFGEMRNDENEDNGAFYPWDYTSPFMDLGLLERRKRFQHATMQYSGTGSLAMRALVRTAKESELEFGVSTSTLEDPNDAGFRKVRLQTRGTHVQIKFEANDPSESNTKDVQGFSIEAERIGIR